MRLIRDGDLEPALKECEKAVGRTLSALRSMVRSGDRMQERRARWELLTLLIASRAAQVDHEPTQGTADVVVSPTEPEEFWIEAVMPDSAAEQARDRLSRFIAFVHRRIRRARIAPETVAVHLSPLGSDPIEVGEDTSVLTNHDGWGEALERLRTKKGPVTLILCDKGYNLQLDLVRSTGEFLSSGYPAPQPVQSIEAHGIYRSLSKKSQQIKRWGSSPVPIVVCIAVTGENRGLDVVSHSEVGAREALVAALHETSSWSETKQANEVPHARGRNLRLDSARRIAAVVAVSIEKPIRLALTPFLQANAVMLPNPLAEFPLSQSQRETLSLMPFGRVRVWN